MYALLYVRITLPAPIRIDSCLRPCRHLQLPLLTLLYRVLPGMPLGFDYEQTDSCSLRRVRWSQNCHDSHGPRAPHVCVTNAKRICIYRHALRAISPEMPLSFGITRGASLWRPWSGSRSLVALKEDERKHKNEVVWSVMQEQSTDGRRYT